MRIEDKKIVLIVNLGWTPIGETDIKSALVAMNSGHDGIKAAKALDIRYERSPTGEWDFSTPKSIAACSWEEWIQLDVPEYREAIHTSKMRIRIPTILVAINFAKVPKKQIKLSTQNILNRDNNTCQYTGEKLSRHELSVDHVISKDEWRRRGLRGTPDSWHNMVACNKNLNTRKSNKSLDEMGLKLIRQPKAPLPIPVSALIKTARHEDWAHFIFK